MLVVGAMTSLISVTTGATVGVVSFLALVILTINCLHKRSHHSTTITKSARSASFVSKTYHNHMTLVASPRRLAILELEQQEEAFVSSSPSTDCTHSSSASIVRF